MPFKHMQSVEYNDEYSHKEKTWLQSVTGSRGLGSCVNEL